ncbi:hypothetical protein KSF_107390 [Reticulibacter mediterranei]|uniref:Uncharacterized protein n=1 Tax=Reticulibacter mediterranei TaxID=2778369 RepID=A0A8J3ITU3_9CHLR|nr:hypothetical protein [Reticulibacter mediterranei]GHP00692.1 hypothetical protein KSF_107390 [Reticulibacter mediterranei]
MPQYRNVILTIVPGNIIQEPAEGLMTLINSSGLWLGGVDGAIQSVAGNQFHQQAAQQITQSTQIHQGMVIFADGTHIHHNGAFRHASLLSTISSFL